MIDSDQSLSITVWCRSRHLFPATVVLCCCALPTNADQHDARVISGLLCVLCDRIVCDYLGAFDCDGTVFDDDDVYECDDGECILRGFRCDGRDDCADGSDEGAENCGKSVSLCGCDIPH